MISHLEVKQVSIKGQVGFQIQGYYRQCSDAYFESIAHAAVFRDRGRAEAFLKRVRFGGKPSWKYDYSQWSISDDVPLPVYSVL
jgi:hypothetical protein